MTDKTETELLPVTQEDIAIALEHLGYDSVDDLHYWAENDTELRRFDELCSRFARHRLNTRTNQGHLEQALASANRQLREAARQLAAQPAQGHDALVEAMEIITLWMDWGGADGAYDSGKYLEAKERARRLRASYEAHGKVAALANLPTPQVEAAPDDGLVEELENLAARTRGMWSFDQANELCALFPRILTALRARNGEAE